MPTSARAPPSGRTRAIDQLRAPGLGVARDDAAGGDVRPALVLEEARDRQPREIGIALDDLLARRLADEHRLERRLQRASQERPEAALVDAERLGDERAPGQ